MPGTFERMKIHFSLCAQHLQQSIHICANIPTTTLLAYSHIVRRILAAGWLRAREETPCEMCLTTDPLGCASEPNQ